MTNHRPPTADVQPIGGSSPTTRLFIILLWLTTSFAHAKTPPRFLAKFSDGSRFEAQQLTHWNVATSAPKLDNRPILDANNHILWLINRGLFPRQKPKAFVEMFSGDCLPGIAVGFYERDPYGIQREFPHWIVSPQINWRSAKSETDLKIRVESRWVRRVVWQRRPQNDYQPGTVFFRDGRSAKFRSARVGDGYVGLLMKEGTRRVFFSEIAELHLPIDDFWGRYYDELAVLCPDGKARLMQIETVDGLIATTSLQRFNVYAWGNHAQWDRWSHGVQPAWSLDVLWVPNEGIWSRRFFAPHQVPLCRVPPAKTTGKATLASVGSRLNTNRNAKGGMLRSGTSSYGWGFGVHGTSELYFPLPTLPCSFRGEVGLDRLAEQGGCVRAKIFMAKTPTAVLFHSPFLIGSTNTPTGISLSLGPNPANMKETRQLVLQVDSAHQGRPAGTDPLDIRDSADWLDPMLEIDAGQLQLEIKRRNLEQFAAWQGWHVRTDAEAVWSNQWREIRDTPGRYFRQVAFKDKSLVLTRRFRLKPSDRWLMISANQWQVTAGGPELEVRFDGETVAFWKVPYRNRTAEPSRLALPLELYHEDGDNSLEVQIRQRGDAPGTLVNWESITVARRLPMLRALFEDDGKFDPVEPKDPNKVAKLVTDNRHSGKRAVKVPSGESFQMRLPKQAVVRENPELGQFRFIRFAYSKPDQGRVCMELDSKRADGHPTRYDAGLGEPTFPKTVRTRADKLNGQWFVDTRDLYADFGKIEFDGLKLTVPDGDHALFDHIYLARRIEDFQRLDDPAKGWPKGEALDKLTKPIVDRVKPACVKIDFGNGRFGSGVIIDAEGHILTAGHLVVGLNGQAKVYLSDKRVANADRRGVCRDRDWGMLKIADKGPWPLAPTENVQQLSQAAVYIGITHKKAADDHLTSISKAVKLRRVLPGNVWTDWGLDKDDSMTGGPLFNQNGAIIGVHTRRSHFGGFHYDTLNDFAPIIDRLKKSEVWGVWNGAARAMVGLSLTDDRRGCVVTAATDKSPAAMSGIQAGDLLTKVAGQPVKTTDDVARLLGDKDPGVELDFEYTRNGTAKTVKLKLAVRMP